MGLFTSYVAYIIFPLASASALKKKKVKKSLNAGDLMLKISILP